MPDWRDEIVEAVSAWLAVEEGGGTRRARPQRIGAARPEGTGGWYLVDLRGKPFNADDLEDLRPTQAMLTPWPAAASHLSTNIAVDNALAGVMKERKDRAGRLVRVGTPHLRAIANDPDVCLPRLVVAHCQEVENERGLVERTLVAIRERAEQLKELERDLAGYDHRSYQEAKALLAAEARIAALAEQAHLLTTPVEDAARLEVAATQDLERAEASWDEIAEAREHLERAAILERQLADVDAEVNRLDDELRALSRHGRKLAQELDALEASSSFKRLQRLGDGRRLSRELTMAQRDYALLDERTQAARARSDQQRPRLVSRIAEHRRAAGLVDAAEVTIRRDALAAAQQAAADAEECLQRAQQQLEVARRARLTAEEGPRPSATQRRLVADADRTGQPGRHAELERARRAAHSDQQEQERLEERHEALLLQLERLRRDAEGAIIRQAQLVATTLARVRLHPAVAAGPYDVVLIDEVSAATVPEVLLAAAKARDTVVLLGDFLQLGPVLPPAIRRSDRPDVQRWLLQDCFGIGGITTAEHARQHPGCAVLTPNTALVQI